MQRALPDALDLLTISVEAGLGFDAALSQVARNTEGPLAEEFARVLQEMQIGMGRATHCARWESAATLPTSSVRLAMVQADALGIPVGQVLRVQSREMRTKRRQRAEEAAQKVAVKILIPMIFCILPCLFVAVIGPAIIGMMGASVEAALSDPNASSVWPSPPRLLSRGDPRARPAFGGRCVPGHPVPRRDRRRRRRMSPTSSWNTTRWIACRETVLVGLVMGLDRPEGALLIPYLVVPTPGRLSRGHRGASSGAVLARPSAAGRRSPSGRRPGARALSSWRPVGRCRPWARGLGTQSVLQLRGTAAPDDHGSYESARQLLTQLRSVARRLSSGLDSVSWRNRSSPRPRALEDSPSGFSSGPRAGSWPPRPTGVQSQQSSFPRGPWSSGAGRRWSRVRASTSGPAEARHRLALPLRVGTRMIGVVVSVLPLPPAGMVLGVMTEVDQQACASTRPSSSTRSDRWPRRGASAARPGDPRRNRPRGGLARLRGGPPAVDATPDARPRLRELRAEISRVVTELRLSIFDLRSEISPADGLGAALSDYVRRSAPGPG